MNTTKTHLFLKEWRQLSSDRKSVDYRIAKWCQALRAEFQAGDAGDRGFHRWLDSELTMPAKEREALLDMARAFKVIPDQETWDAQGFGQIRPLVRMPAKERLAIQSAAKVENKKFCDVIRARDRSRIARSGPQDPAAERASDDAEIIRRWACRQSAEVLAAALSGPIASGAVVAPSAVLAAAKRRIAEQWVNKSKRAS